MDKKQKVDFLKRFKQGRALIEELEPLILLIFQNNYYQNYNTGKVYSEVDVQRLKDLKICIVVIDECDKVL